MPLLLRGRVCVPAGRGGRCAGGGLLHAGGVPVVGVVVAPLTVALVLALLTVAVVVGVPCGGGPHPADG